jgi:rare lipoprotein A
LRFWGLAGLALLCAFRAQAGEIAGDPAYARYSEIGVASWYGGAFNGGRTSDGERFDMGSISAAHRTLPLPCYARVTNLRNGRSIVVRVNDRGPFVRGRLIDLSARAATLLDFRSFGMARVKVDYFGKAPTSGGDGAFLLASLHGAPAAPAPTAAAPLAYTVAATAKLVEAPALAALNSANHAVDNITRVERSAPSASSSPYGDLTKSPFLEVVAGY